MQSFVRREGLKWQCSVIRKPRGCLGSRLQELYRRYWELHKLLPWAFGPDQVHDLSALENSQQMNEGAHVWSPEYLRKNIQILNGVDLGSIDYGRGFG